MVKLDYLRQMISQLPFKSINMDAPRARVAAVTGGSGFIGANLVVRLLAKGWTVRILSRDNKFSLCNHPSLKVHHGDMLDQNKGIVEFLTGSDILFNCAAEIRDQTRMWDLNVHATVQLAELSVGRIKRWIQVGSAGVYGMFRGGLIDEGVGPRPVGLYEKSKKECDDRLMNMFKNGKLDVCILQPTTIFGPGMANRSLYSLIHHIRKKNFFYIGDPIAGNYWANYVYVDDVVSAMEKTSLRDDSCGKTYIISDSTPFHEFISDISSLTGVNKPGVIIPRWLGLLAGMTGSVFPRSPITVNRVRAMSDTTHFSRALFDREIGCPEWIGVKGGLSKYIEGAFGNE